MREVLDRVNEIISMLQSVAGTGPITDKAMELRNYVASNECEAPAAPDESGEKTEPPGA